MEEANRGAMAGYRTEAQTRQEIIDQRLKLADWDVNDPSQVIQELDIYLERGGVVREPRVHPYRGHRFADYALIHCGGPIAMPPPVRFSI